MKLLVTGIAIFLLCNTINAQLINADYRFRQVRFSQSGFNTENFDISDKLSNPIRKDGRINGTAGHLKNTVMGVATVSPYLLTAFTGGKSSWDDGLKMDMKTRTLISAGLFIPTMATGYLMRGSNGDPGDALLTIHKITSVSNLILLDATALKKRKLSSLSFLESLVAITMNVSFVATITTGSLQSVGKTMPGWVNTSHKITPWITILSSGVLLYLLNNN